MNSNIRNTIHEMLNDRQYLNIKQFDNDSDIIFECFDTNNNKILIINNETKIGIKEIQRIQNKIKHLNIFHSIIITEKDLTPQAKKNIDKEINIEFFLYKNLIFNITKHILQPKFRIMEIDEINFILKSLNCSLSNLPKISVNDPISRYYNAKIKDVFEIKRKDEIYYRLVI